jgi:hypothetical protein
MTNPAADAIKSCTMAIVSYRSLFLMPEVWQETFGHLVKMEDHLQPQAHRSDTKFTLMMGFKSSSSDIMDAIPAKKLIRLLSVDFSVHRRRE